MKPVYSNNNTIICQLIVGDVKGFSIVAVIEIANGFRGILVYLFEFIKGGPFNSLGVPIIFNL